MSYNPDDPFADITFDSGAEPDTSVSGAGPDLAPTVTMDDMSTLLRSFNRQGMPIAPQLPNVTADTKGGAARVNQDTPATGVVAYKDAKGQTVLTNVARNPNTGKEESLLEKPGSNPSVLTQQAGLEQVTKPLTLNSIIEALSNAKDSSAARGLFASFQEAAAKEQMRIQGEAETFAANKIGVPSLEQSLKQAELADRADPKWYPGIGDSPITQKIRIELNAARGLAEKQAEIYLKNNLSYKMLGNSLKQAEAEMNRIQRYNDRQEILTDQKILSAEQRAAQKEEDLARQAEGMSAVELARIQALSPGESWDNVTNPKVKAFQLFKNNKNKDFQAAVTAEANGESLPSLALKGNAYAETLFVADEAKKTGMPEDYVKAQMKSMKTFIDSLASPKAMENAIKARYIKPDGTFNRAEFQNEMGLISKAGYDTTKEGKVSDLKIRLAFEAVARKKTEKYLGDTSSWDSIDPTFRAAIDQARKTAGNASMENTLTAYLGDSTGPERLQKAATFDSIAKAAAQKHAESAFGMPDYGRAAAVIARKAVADKTFRTWFNARLAEIAKTKLPVSGVGGPSDESQGAMLSGMGGPLGSLLGIADASIQGASDLFKPDVAPINPLTNKPFGE